MLGKLLMYLYSFTISNVNTANATKIRIEKTNVIIEKIFLTISSPPWVYYSIKVAEGQDLSEIVRFAHGPSPNPTKSDFITQVISSIEDGFIPSDRTDLVEKERQVFRLVFLFLVPLTGLEPVRYRYRGILSPLCLPIPPHRRIYNNIIIKTQCQGFFEISYHPFFGWYEKL